MERIGYVANHAAARGLVADEAGNPIGTYRVRDRWGHGEHPTAFALLHATFDGILYEAIKSEDAPRVRFFPLPRQGGEDATRAAVGRA